MGLVWLFLPAVLGAQAPSDETEPTEPTEPAETETETETESESGGSLTVSGSVHQRYRFRHSGAGDDQDLYGSLNLDATYAPEWQEGKGLFDKLKFNLQGSYNLDIDSFETAGDASQGASFLPFLDITNTFSDRFRGFIHSAYGEVEDFGFLEWLRLGRQQIYREEGILFDGARARTKRWNTLTFDVYGGLPTHLYESSPSGDAFGGAGIESRPLRGLSIGADYFFIRDQNDVSDEEEHLYLVRGRYDIDREWTVSGSASWVDTRDRRQVIDVRYLSESSGLLASLRAVRQNGVVGFQTSELSPYLFIQGEYAPYYQVQLDLHQPVNENFGVGGGFNIRQLEDSSDDGLYNHDFRNAYVSVEASDFWEGASASVRGDIWDSDDDDIYAVGFELEQKVGDLLRIRVGTSYSLYRIDFFTGTEKERDRIYYARLRWHLAPGVDLDTDYQYEKDSITEYHTVTTGMRLWF